MTIENDIIYFTQRKGTQEDPYLDITETLFVQYGKVFLKEIPVKSFKVTVQNANNTYMTEVFTNDGLTTTNTFFVNYKEGIVYFNASNNGLSKKFVYKGQGVILFPASRIYTSSPDGSSIITSLQETVGLAQNITPRGTYSATVNYKKGNIVFLNDISYMCLQDVKGVTPPNATYWQIVLRGGIAGDKGETGAIGPAGPPGPAGENKYVWVKYADSTTSGMSDSPTGKAYIGIAVNKSSATKSLVYSDYAWSLIRGEQGIQGIQGEPGQRGSDGSVAAVWKGVYAAGTAYPAGSLVSYSGRVYIAKQASTGNLPTNTTFWDLFADKGADGAGSVTSVNTKSGAVVLTNTDVGAPSTSDFTAHTGNGTVHITSTERTAWNAKASTSVATTAANGLMSSADKTKLDGLSNYTHPATHAPSIIAQDVNNRFVTDAEKAVWNAKASSSVATTSSNGLMSSADKTKLDGMTNYIHPVNHPPSIITQDANNRFVTDAEKAAWNSKPSGSVATSTTNGMMSSTDKVKLDSLSSSVASTTTNGMMSAADKTKLDGIATGATAYTHPATHAPSIITQDASNRFVTDTEKSTWNAKASTSVATTAANGLMSSTDKTKLDGIAANANNYTHPATHAPSIIVQDASNRFVTDAEKATWNGKINSSEKGVANGVARLNASGQVIDAAGNVVAGGSGGSGDVTMAELDKRMVNLQRFGLVGNGVADDTQAMLTGLQYCIANNKTAFVPRGTYIIAPNIIRIELGVNEVLKIVGDGINTVFKRKDQTTTADWMLMFEIGTKAANVGDAQLVHFENLKIDSNARNQQTPPTDPYDYEHCADINIAGLANSYIQYVVMKDIYTDDPVADGLYISGEGSAYVRNVDIDGFYTKSRTRMRSDICITGGVESASIMNVNVKSLEYEFNMPYVATTGKSKALFANIITDNLDITGVDDDVEFYGSNIVAQHTFLAAMSGHISNSYLKFEGGPKLSPDEGRMIAMKDFTFSDSTMVVSAPSGAVIPFRISDENRLKFNNVQFLISTLGTSFTGNLIEMEPNDIAGTTVTFDNCTYDPRAETCFRFNRCGQVIVKNSKINNPTPFRLYSTALFKLDLEIDNVELGDACTSSLYLEGSDSMKLKVRNFTTGINAFEIVNANSGWTGWTSWSVERTIRINQALTQAFLLANASPTSAILSKGDRFIFQTNTSNNVPSIWEVNATAMNNFNSALANIVALSPTFGTTAQRPTCYLQAGYQYFDTTLAKPVVWTGSAWVELGGGGGTTTLTIEQRTSDPASPAIGQVWIRTDL